MMLALAATLGHEVNNPLTAVFGYLDAARGHLADGRGKEALDALAKLEEAAERIRAVVAQLLANQDPHLRTILPGISIIDSGPRA